MRSGVAAAEPRWAGHREDHVLETGSTQARSTAISSAPTTLGRGCLTAGTASDRPGGLTNLVRGPVRIVVQLLLGHAAHGLRPGGYYAAASFAHVARMVARSRSTVRSGIPLVELIAGDGSSRSIPSSTAATRASGPSWTRRRCRKSSATAWSSGHRYSIGPRTRVPPLPLLAAARRCLASISLLAARWTLCRACRR